MRTEAERLASYRAAFLEKVKKWNWNDGEECNHQRKGRKMKEAKQVRKGMYRNEAEKRAWEKQQSQQVPKKNKYNWL